MLKPAFLEAAEKSLADESPDYAVDLNCRLHVCSAENRASFIHWIGGNGANILGWLEEKLARPPEKQFDAKAVRCVERLVPWLKTRNALIRRAIARPRKTASIAASTATMPATLPSWLATAVIPVAPKS